MTEIYDSISSEYQETNTSLKRKYSCEETFLMYLGDVKGKTVLDLACGDGYYSRCIKRNGAGEVLGVDVSKCMLALAEEKEKKNPLKIKYKQFNAAELPKLGEFDIITAAFLLHYSKSKDELFKMCKNIRTNLKKGGRFIALNLNPANPLQGDKRYDSTITASGGKLREGSVLKVVLYRDNCEICSFNNYHWGKETYEEALRTTGFKDIKWHKIIVSDEGIKKFGPSFWENYLKQPGLIVIEAQ